MYALRTRNERLQILIDAERRRRLDEEARRRGTSVASLIGEAVDEHLGAPSREERLRAVAKPRGMRGRLLSVEEMHARVDPLDADALRRLLGP